MYIPEYKGFCKSMSNTPQPTVFTVSLEEIKKHDRMWRLLEGQPILDDTFTEEERERLLDEIKAYGFDEWPKWSDLTNLSSDEKGSAEERKVIGQKRFFHHHA